MAERGPFYYLWNDEGPLHYSFDSNVGPAIWGRNAQGQWVPVPIDRDGFPQGEYWRNVPPDALADPTDQNSLRRSGIDVDGRPYDWSKDNFLSDALSKACRAAG